MGFVGFLHFGLKCIQLLAWPSLSLGYPLCASIRAIETNSNYHMRKLVTYWILYSLISLFEHTFEKLIEWVPFWPYIKILAVCWLVIPSFGGAYNAYKSLGETFLALAERYVSENGTEALEKLIAKKGALQKFDVEEIKSFAVGEKKEVAMLIQPKSKEPIVARKDIKGVEILEENAAAPENSVKNVVDTLFSHTDDETIAMEVKNMTLLETIGENALPEYPVLKYVQKEWTCAVCQVTTQSEETLNSHLQGTEHKSKCEELKARKQTAKNKNPSSATENKLDQSKQDTEGVSNGGLDKEWTCAICQVTTHSEAIFNLHLHGVKHWLKCEELKAREQTEKKSNSSPSTPKSDQANQDTARGLSGGGPNKQWNCALCQVTLQSEATMNSHFQGSKHRSKCEQLKASEMAAKNKNSSLANKTDQTNQDHKKNVAAGGLNKNTSKITTVKVQADVNTLKHWCSVCDVTCSSESPMASHLKGRRHLLQIQDLARVHYWCNICDVTCKSEIDMVSHLNGDRHFSQLED